MCGRGPLVLKGPPEAILAILRSAQSGTPDPRLADVLEAFRSRWHAIARKRYRGMEDDVEDAVQAALLKLVSGDKLDRLKDVSRLEAWARSLFVNTVLDVAREGMRHRRGRTYVGQPDEDPEEALRTANRRWIARYERVEALAASRGAVLAELSPEARDELWDEVKAGP